MNSQQVDEMSADERLTVWLNLHADRDQVPDDDRQAYIDILRGTFLAQRQRFQYSVDVLAEEGAVGKMFAFLLGWRPDDARFRRAELGMRK